MKTLNAVLFSLLLVILGVQSSIASEKDCRPALVVSAVHRLPDSISVMMDPDWLSALEDEAQAAVKSGEWAKRFSEHTSLMRRWAIEPMLPPSPPPAVQTSLREQSTGIVLAADGNRVLFQKGSQTIDLTDRYPASVFQGFSKLYLFIDASRPTELAFAQALEKALGEASNETIPMLVVLTGGSLRQTAGVLSSRLFADQGASLTRRLRLRHSPSLVRLTAETITVFSPALQADGLPDEAVPTSATGLTKPLQLDNQSGRRLNRGNHD